MPATILTTLTSSLISRFLRQCRYIALFLGILSPWLHAIPLCQSYSEYLKLWGGNMMQVVSLHAVMSLDFAPNQAPNQISNQPQPNQSSIQTRINGGVGASVGVTYVHTDDERDFDFGWRIKYFFLDSRHLNQSRHLIGASLYLHPFPNPYHKWSGAIQTHKDCEDKDDGFPTPFSFVIGSGSVIIDDRAQVSAGGYIEAGIAFFKWFVINGEVLYRASFYPLHNQWQTTHSINFILNLF
ncbi:hypothetical protein [uncultured Helicobacter sp.]|uniref:hypothetical protein n=1 Tax=uncultured Helicobacter sp. TaxID=175537 RepID=UPI002591E07D|nr:hypothetical protein [uncultured Helicobacter sp.]